MTALAIEDLTVTYAGARGPVAALDSFSLTVAPGGMTILLGESGCGKSTALNAIAGLIEPSSGRIRLGDNVLYEGRGRRATTNASPNHRNIGMVFQSYALWPHLSVLDNVMYPLRRQRVPRADAERRAREALAVVRCEILGDRNPGELSGGQQQRVALARAIVSRPKLLLFDEPLSNLDAGLRRGLRDELARLHRELGFTGVYVTHDQSEALSLGTDVAVMSGGRVVQSGKPAEIYERPATEYVARFFGANVIPGRIIGASASIHQIETAAGIFESAHLRGEGSVSVAFMPQDARLELAADGPLTVASALYLGSHREIRVTTRGCDIIVVQPASAPAPDIGARARLHVAASATHTYPA
jgi:iron(III) transport system ATP-binding protein